MNVQFSAAFYALKTYLGEKIPEFTEIVVHWIEPNNASDGLAMLLPESHYTEDGKITFNADLWFYTVKPNRPEDVVSDQVAIMEKVFNAVYSSGALPLPILKAVISESEYRNDLPKPSGTGLAHARIEMIMEFDDDC